MSWLQSLGTVVALIGIAIRLMTWRRYFDLYSATRRSAPPRSWLWTRDPDPAIERARMPLVVGSVVAIVGFVLLIVGIVTV